jgi:hypothetical protein
MPSHTAAAAKKQAPTDDWRPASRAEPGAIERRNNWLVLSADQTRKRIVCKCAFCGHFCTIGTEALKAGVNCPNCLNPRSATPSADSFAGAVADLEGWGARGRHRGAS